MPIFSFFLLLSYWFTKSRASYSLIVKYTGSSLYNVYTPDYPNYYQHTSTPTEDALWNSSIITMTSTYSYQFNVWFESQSSICPNDVIRVLKGNTNEILYTGNAKNFTSDQVLFTSSSGIRFQLVQRSFCSGGTGFLAYVNPRDKFGTVHTPLVFGLIFIINVGIPVLCGLMYYFGIFERLTNRISGRRYLAEVAFLKEEEYDKFLLNLSRSPYVGNPWCFPNGRCLFPPGLLEDYFRLLANNHSVIGMLLSDLDHAYSRFHRCICFFTSKSFGFVCVLFLRTFQTHYSYPFWFEPLFTLAVINPFLKIFDNLLYFIIVCPCFYDKRSICSCVGLLVASPVIFIGIMLCVMAGFFVNALTEDENGAVYFVMVNYFVLIIIIKCFQDAIFLSFKFININRKGVLAIVFYGLNCLTFGYMNIGCWYTNKEEAEGDITRKERIARAQEVIDQQSDSDRHIEIEHINSIRTIQRVEQRPQQNNPTTRNLPVVQGVHVQSNYQTSRQPQGSIPTGQVVAIVGQALPSTHQEFLSSPFHPQGHV